MAGEKRIRFQIESGPYVPNLDILYQSASIPIADDLLEWHNDNPLWEYFGTYKPRAEMMFTVLHQPQASERRGLAMLLPLIELKHRFPEHRQKLFISTSDCLIPREHFEPVKFDAERVLDTMVYRARDPRSNAQGTAMHTFECEYIRRVVEQIKNKWVWNIRMFEPFGNHLQIRFTAKGDGRERYSPIFHLVGADLDRQVAFRHRGMQPVT